MFDHIFEVSNGRRTANQNIRPQFTYSSNGKLRKMIVIGLSWNGFDNMHCTLLSMLSASRHNSNWTQLPRLDMLKYQKINQNNNNNKVRSAATIVGKPFVRSFTRNTHSTHIYIWATIQRVPTLHHTLAIANHAAPIWTVVHTDERGASSTSSAQIHMHRHTCSDRRKTRRLYISSAACTHRRGATIKSK